jgi:hypothetical protein
MRRWCIIEPEECCVFLKKAVKIAKNVVKGAGKVVKKALPVVAVAAAVFTAGASLAALAGSAAVKGAIGAIASKTVIGSLTVGGVAKGISTGMTLARLAGVGVAKPRIASVAPSGVMPAVEPAERTSSAVADEEAKKRRALQSRTGFSSTFGAGVFAPRPMLGSAGMLG